MAPDRWFNRLIEYWSLPPPAEVVDHVRRGKVQVVQMGNFGPDFYSLADDESIERSWAGMPLYGIQPNLDLAAELIPQVQEAGAVVVGQLSMTMHFGDHHKGLGLFGRTWEHMWTPELLGTAPCEGAHAAVQTDAAGQPDPRTIEGRPYFTYRGCICNPNWVAILESMVTKGINLGLDGFNTTHNYESFCSCTHCVEYVRRHLQQDGSLGGDDLQALFGTRDLEEVEDVLEPLPDLDPGLKRRYDRIVWQTGALRRKEVFDEVFIDHGRGLRPGLWLAQWYHKYGLRVDDERAGLPAPLWARDEDYIWYSQGPYRWGSSLEQGYIADMGLPSRFMHAAGGGRPFVVNKYDYRRWRVWAGEAAAHGGAALAFHAGPPRPGQEETTRVAPEDYYGPVIRCQRFLAEQENLLHPATPWSQVGLVYPRRQERERELDCVDAFKRVGEWLEDAHVLFDVLLDEQLCARAGNHRALILPEIKRLSREELSLLDEFVVKGGCLLLTGTSGALDVDGTPHELDRMAHWRTPPENGGHLSTAEAGAGRVIHLAGVDWQPKTVRIRMQGDPEMPVYNHLPEDDLGQAVAEELHSAIGGPWLRTDAPWYVRVRTWRPESDGAIVIHWINYLQDEQAAIETPIPVGQIQATCRLPDGYALERMEWRYPEMREPEAIDCEVDGADARFTIPRLIVHGMSVIRLRPA
ncbi:MAG: hypothetical protein QGI83_16445 [Candidatus Latescibacteria bacterium]|jgi:hypothetical protein|nr:hypothetical protein [Candidatus Latescibacterota bacterium]